QRWLLQPTDRLKFVNISVEEFEAIERKVDEGTYQINITGYSKVSLNSYKAWVDTLDVSRRF
ncbi:MAG: 5-oxoprolinase subunit B family protein, partial [Gammaproteobacteria bacterium]